MTEHEQAHVKVTINDLYKEQQETNKLLIQLVTKVEGLSDLPARVSNLENKLAEINWIPRVIWTALSAGIIGLGTSLYSLITKG
jgi:hypothetical protein